MSWDSGSEDFESDGSEESSADDHSPREAGQSPRAVLAADLSFREGSYARYCRPDPASADYAKASLIVESVESDGWGAMPEVQDWFEQPFTFSATLTKKAYPSDRRPKSSPAGSVGWSPAASQVVSTTAFAAAAVLPKGPAHSAYRRGTSAPLAHRTKAPPPRWSGSVSPSKRTEPRENRFTNSKLQGERRFMVEQRAERRQRIAQRTATPDSRAQMVLDYIKERQPCVHADAAAKKPAQLHQTMPQMVQRPNPAPSLPQHHRPRTAGWESPALSTWSLGGRQSVSQVSLGHLPPGTRPFEHRHCIWLCSWRSGLSQGGSGCGRCCPRARSTADADGRVLAQPSAPASQQVEQPCKSLLFEGALSITIYTT